MSNSSSVTGLVRFAPKNPSKPLVDLTDPVEAMRHIGKLRTRAAIHKELVEVPDAIRGEVIEGLAAHHPKAVIGLMVQYPHPSSSRPRLFTDSTIETVAPLLSDSTLDQMVAARGWAFQHPATRRRMLERVRDVAETMPAAVDRLGGEDWAKGAVELAASDDPDLLASLARQRLALRAALPAASRLGLRLRELMPPTVAQDDVDVFAQALVDTTSVDDDDVAWLAEHCDLLGDQQRRPRWRLRVHARLTRDQRLVLLRTGHPWLMALAAQALVHDQPEPDELQLLRTIASGPDPHEVMAVLIAGRQSQAVLDGWVRDWILTAEDIEPVADLLDFYALNADAYVTIGQRLSTARFGGWLRRGSQPFRARLVQRIGVAGLVERLEAFKELQNDDGLCELPGLPAAFAASPKPPRWAATVVTKALGESRLILRACQELIDEGFEGSFRELRERVLRQG